MWIGQPPSIPPPEPGWAGGGSGMSGLLVCRHADGWTPHSYLKWHNMVLYPPFRSMHSHPQMHDLSDLKWVWALPGNCVVGNGMKVAHPCGTFMYGGMGGNNEVDGLANQATALTLGPMEPTGPHSIIIAGMAAPTPTNKWISTLRRCSQWPSSSWTT